MRNFILSYNTAATPLSSEQVIAFVRENRRISEWLFPFDGTFLIKSQEEFMPLYISFRRFFGNYCHFIMAEFNIDYTAGVLTEEMWDWINKGILPEDAMNEIRKVRLFAGSPDAVKREDEKSN